MQIGRTHDRREPDMAQGGKAMKCYKDFREFLSVLDQQGQLLPPSETRLNSSLTSYLRAFSALAQIGDTAPAILFDKIAGCIDAQVRDERTRFLQRAQSCVGARDGQGSLTERAVPRVRPALQAVSRGTRARHDRALAGSDGRQGHQSVRPVATVSSEPRRWRVLH